MEAAAAAAVDATPDVFCLIAAAAEADTVARAIAQAAAKAAEKAEEDARKWSEYEADLAAERAEFEAEAATDIQSVMRATSSMTGATDNCHHWLRQLHSQGPWKIRRKARQEEIKYSDAVYTADQQKQKKYEYETRLRDIRRNNNGF